MNSTFKITSAADQLDIIHYTVPPAVKPRRQQAPRLQEVIVEKCSLPALTPNSLFDEPGESVNNLKSLTSNLAEPHGGGCEILGPSTLEADFPELESTGEHRFQEPVYLALLNTSLISYVPTAKESSFKGESTHYSPIGAESIQSSAQQTSSAGPDVLEEPPKNSTMKGIQSTPVLTPQTMALTSSGTETKDSTGCGDEQIINNAAEEGAKSDEDCDDGEVSLQNSDTEDPGLRYDDLIPSGLETSGIPSEPTPATQQPRATEESRRSAKWSIRPVSPVGQSLRKPSSLHTTQPHFRSSASIKVPRHKAGISSRPSHLEKDHPSRTSKRQGPTMSVPLSKRNRPLAVQPEAKVLSDSESSDWAAGDDHRVNEATPVKVKQTRSTSRLSQPPNLLRSKFKRSDRGSVEVFIPRLQSSRRQKHKAPREAKAVLQNTDNKPAPLSTMFTNLSVHPVRPDDGGYLTAVVDDLTNVGPLLKSPAAFGLTDDIAVRLTNASVKPVTPALWLLTATISRTTPIMQSPKDRRLDSPMDISSDDGASDNSERSSATADSIHHCPSDMETDREIPQTTRGRWSKDEDKKLRDMKQSGEPWSEICEEFPGRTEGAVKARWYIVLAPKSH